MSYRPLQSHMCPALCRTSSQRASAGRPSADEEEAGPKESARDFLMKTANEKLSEAFDGAFSASFFVGR